MAEGVVTFDSDSDIDGDSTAIDGSTMPMIAADELLYFIQQKSKIIALDHLMKLCTDFYTVEEITLFLEVQRTDKDTQEQKYNHNDN